MKSPGINFDLGARHVYVIWPVDPRRPSNPQERLCQFWN